MSLGSSGMAARPAWVDDKLFPFTSRFLELSGNVVHYIDEGRGPVLLMLHGNPTWSFVYRDVITQLSGSFRCIALDYPGFGLSTPAPRYQFHPADHARVVAEFVDHLDLRDVTLIAQDWGGPIGLTAVLQRQDRFSALVVANTWAWPVNGDPHFELFSRFMGGPIGRLLIRHFNFFVNAMIPAGHRRRRPTADEMSHYRQALPTPQRRNPSAVFPKDITAARAFLTDLEHGLKALADMPTMIIWGDADVAFPAKERRRWEALMPRQTSPTPLARGATSSRNNRISRYAMHPKTTTADQKWAWAAVAAAAVVTAACGGGSNGGSNTGSAPKAAAVHVPANFCGLLSGTDISQMMGRTFAQPEGSQSTSEAQCDSVPTAGNDVSFKLYWNNLYCIDGKPADEQCLNSQAKGFVTNKQTAGQVQNVPGLGDQAFCFVAPPATVDVLKGWIYLTVSADSCVQAQTLAGMLLAKIST